MYDSQGEAGFRRKLGRRLAKIREAKNIPQSELMRRTGLSIGFISRVECGRAIPSILTLRVWAGKGLQANLDEVLDGLK